MSLSLYPHVGTLGTAEGRTAILSPVFSGEWSAEPPLFAYGGRSVVLADPAGVSGGVSVLLVDPSGPSGGRSILVR